MIESYSEKSDLGAPDRKYYRVNSSFNLSISVSNDNFTIRNEDIEELRYKEADNLYKKFDELYSITFYHNDKVNQTVNDNKNTKDTKIRQIVSLGQILSKLQKNLEDTEGQILYLESRLNDLRALKQAIIKKMHDIEKAAQIEILKEAGIEYLIVSLDPSTELETLEIFADSIIKKEK